MRPFARCSALATFVVVIFCNYRCCAQIFALYLSLIYKHAESTHTHIHTITVVNAARRPLVVAGALIQLSIHLRDERDFLTLPQ